MERIGILGWLTIIAVLIAGCYIIVPAAYKIYRIEKALKMQPTEEERIEIKKKLKKHGLDRQISVIYISHDGKEWFERDGKRCKF